MLPLVLVLMTTRQDSRTKAAEVVRSVKSGNWSDPTVWSANRVPLATDLPTIENGHTVTFNQAVSVVSGVEVKAGGTLQFDPAKTLTLSSSANVIINGTLIIKPGNTSFTHTLRFININENNFVGGGMTPIASDVGLWVMGDGKLIIQGAPKTAWTRLEGGITAGSTTAVLTNPPQGWLTGDDIVITPTENPNVGDASFTGFDEAKITSLNSATLRFDKPTARAHPKVNNTWTAEMLNLTRNVNIEGTQSGRSHIFIHSTKPQVINDTSIRYMGPRKDTNNDGQKEFVLGRYGIHFHMAGNGSRGSTVNRTVIKNSGSHAFVPHASHGIVFDNAIAYDVMEDAFWWDPQAHQDPAGKHDSRDIIYSHAVAAKVLGTASRTAGFDLGAGAPTGFNPTDSSGNVVKDSVAVGIKAGVESSGFEWPEGEGAGIWDFSMNNIAHNNAGSGIFAWQNGGGNHEIRNFAAYYNKEMGIDHGAYVNIYKYKDINLYGNKQLGLRIHTISAMSKLGEHDQLSFEDMSIDGAGLSPNLIYITRHRELVSATGMYTLFRNINLRGHTGNAAFLIEGGVHPDLVDCVNCTIAPNEFYLRGALEPESLIRVQNGTQAYALRRFDQQGEMVSAWNARRTTIAQFTDKPPVGIIVPDAQADEPSNPGTIRFVRTGFTTNPLTVNYTISGTAVPGSDYARLSGSATIPANENSVLVRIEPLDDTQVETLKDIIITVAPGNGYNLASPASGKIILADSADGGARLPGDTIPPTVTFTSPASKAVVSSTAVTVSATATDNVAIKHVEFTAQNVIDGNNIAISTKIHSEPYSINWNTKLISDGVYTLRALATDTSDVASARYIQVTVDNNPPTINLTAPANGSTVASTTTITANAVDAAGVTKVEFLVDGEIKNTDTKAPYEFPWDTTNGNNHPCTGPHTHVLIAKAYDKANRVTVSSPITVNMNNPAYCISPTPTRIPTATSVPTSTLTRTPTPTHTPAPSHPVTTPPSSTPVPGSTILNINLLLHGIGRGGDSANPGSSGTANPRRPQRPVTVEILNAQNQLVATKSGTVVFNAAGGNFQGSVSVDANISSGIYTIKIKSPQFLKGVVPGIQSITQNTLNTLPQTTLISGDIDDNNKVDILDYNLLMDCYSDLTPATNCSDSSKKQSADLDDDAAVNQFDYNLFLRELTNRAGE